MTDPVLRLDNILVRGGARTLLEVASFSVMPGEIVALIGPNGAGKTTLLHTAALLRQPDEGAVFIQGIRARDATISGLRRSLAIVFQEPLLFDVRVLENAAAGLRFHGVARGVAESRARAWLERFGVGHLAARKARTLSGGEASRVALARAFATEPALLLLDEPFSPLDPPTRAALIPVLRDLLGETGTAAVLVTHDLDEALVIADHLAVMIAGRIGASGRASELIARPPSPQVASLLGVETILPATVTEIASGEATVALDGGGPAVRATIPTRDHVSLGQRLTLTLPAGAIRILPPDEDCPPAWNCLCGIIAEKRPLTTGGARLIVVTPAPISAFAPWEPHPGQWSVGSRVLLSFAPEAVHLIPDDPESRIALIQESGALPKDEGRRP